MLKNEECEKCGVILAVFERVDETGRWLEKYCVGCRKTVSKERLPDIVKKEGK